MTTHKIDHLIKALRCLPGVGPKSAQRMTYHLLQRERDNGLALAQALTAAMTDVKHCDACRNFSETDLCTICAHPARDRNSLCVVEAPTDVFAIEQTASFKGQYFVLMGHLSPIDGIGPSHIGIPLLEQRIKDNSFSEIILATNPTVEGEATAHYIANVVRDVNRKRDTTETHPEIKCTRIAYGVPQGSELDYLDRITLSHAFTARTSLK